MRKKTNKSANPERRERNRKIATKLLLIAAGSLLYVAGIELFVEDNGFITGGVWGIALMIEHLFGVQSGYIVLAINVPLLILSIVFLGWRFTAYTFLFVGLQSLVSVLAGKFNIPKFSDDSFLAAIAAGVIMGTAQAMCLKVGGCTGGTDIVSVILQKKKLQIHVPWVIFIVNASIICVSYFVYGGLKAIILSLILEFVASKVSDTILSGISGAIRFEIVTSKGAEVQDAIVNKLGRGATVIDARGGYTNQSNTVIVCLIHKRQVSSFKKTLRQADPEAFAYVSPVSSVIGKGFSSIDED